MSERVERARAELDSHGLAGMVTAACRDVCADGFGLQDEADAVFLDLPHPWGVVSHARTALKVVFAVRWSDLVVTFLSLEVGWPSLLLLPLH